MTTRSRARLQELWTGSRSSRAEHRDYVLTEDIGRAFAGFSRSGTPALVIQLSSIDAQPIGRRSTGCELIPHRSLLFAVEKREWTAPAATLLCHEPELLPAFAVLAEDVHRRLPEEAPAWTTVVALVEEWQLLLAPLPRLSREAELGLWGELWTISSAADPARLLSAWRGPEGSPHDFFIDGKALEIKASRQHRRHHISVTQLEPLPERSWLLSLWLGIDPIRGRSLPELADQVLDYADDPSAALRLMAKGGYSPSDRSTYEDRYALLATPEWYPMSGVPRVREVDRGVSNLRYVVTLDEVAQASVLEIEALSQHFFRRPSGVIT